MYKYALRGFLSPVQILVTDRYERADCSCLQKRIDGRQQERSCPDGANRGLGKRGIGFGRVLMAMAEVAQRGPEEVPGGRI